MKNAQLELLIARKEGWQAWQAWKPVPETERPACPFPDGSIEALYWEDGLIMGRDGFLAPAIWAAVVLVAGGPDFRVAGYHKTRLEAISNGAWSKRDDDTLLILDVSPAPRCLEEK